MVACTCQISKTPCNSAFVIERATGNAVAEVVISLNPSDLREPERFEMLCAGAALQRLNERLKQAR